MKKIFIWSLVSLSVGCLAFSSSCGTDDEFETENTFHLDTLYVTPTNNIGNTFKITWGVLTQGFPQFRIEIYLSDNELLDAGDPLIAETADTDTSGDPELVYNNDLFVRGSDVTEGKEFEFSYDQTTWEGNAVVQEDLSGQTKFIIGRFFHTAGLQVEVQRTRMAVEVTFQ